MVFSSPDFLFAFLPLALICYFSVLLWPRTRFLANHVLLLFSLLFYFWGGGLLIVQLLEVVAINFVLGLLADKVRRGGGRVDRVVAIAAFFNLSILSYFKYSNFFVEQLNGARNAQGLDPLAWPPIALPIGISFYIFHSISYIVDVAHGDAPVVRSPTRFALYLTLFPQLIAGPIIRYRLVASMLVHRTHRVRDFAAGAARFAHGLVKKVAIADTMAPVANAAFSGVDRIDMRAAWLGILAYTLQIYFDFSGYSDMAIGMGRMFGFRFPENFNRPYSALSVTDFWRRWHITLSDFFRLYVYIPLGGSRCGRVRTHLNLIVVFLLTGLWHGANWTFVVWGLFHGSLLLMERLLNRRILNQPASFMQAAICRLTTGLLIATGWVIFRSQTIAEAAQYLNVAVSPSLDNGMAALWGVCGPKFRLAAALGSLVFLLPRAVVVGRWLEETISRGSVSPPLRLFQNVYLALALVVAALVVSAQDYSPFLYFQF